MFIEGQRTFYKNIACHNDKKWISHLTCLFLSSILLYKIQRSLSTWSIFPLRLSKMFLLLKTHFRMYTSIFFSRLLRLNDYFWY